MLIWSLGIPYFQLPLSGSPSRRRRASEPRSGLSTPSLGITRRELDSRISDLRTSFNSLSRDHLYGLPGTGKTMFATFNSLSRDHKYYEILRDMAKSDTFNSLSRDHTRIGWIAKTGTGLKTFQLPLSGSRGPSE